MVFIWLVSVVAAMGGFLFGYDWVVVGGAKPFYEPFFNITDDTLFMRGLAMSGAFWLFGGICLIGFFVIFKRLPETKGKTLEDIERELVD